MTYRQEKASMEQLLAPVLSECQFQLNRMPKRSCYVSLRTDFGKGIMDAHCQTSCPHSWMELPEIQIKYLNLFSLPPPLLVLFPLGALSLRSSHVREAVSEQRMPTSS